YGLRPGLLSTQLANVPEAPTITNPSNWYNRLRMVLSTSNNPSDTTYAVAISSDNFTTTSYVQSDDTIGSALGLEDYRTYAGWGSGTGTTIIGLTENTIYDFKVKANQGNFTETGYGPEASGTTSVLSIAFDIDVAATDTETAAPYELNLGNVLPGSVQSSSDKMWLDIDSNAASGALVYVVSQNDGLASSTASYTISSVSGDLSALSEGVGAQSSSVSQSSGGPLSAPSPYDGTSDNIGIIDNQFRQILTSSSPLTAGRASFLLKVKVDATTPTASDYADIYTLVAAAAF
ncbi:MAG: hypothetical protein M3Q14_04370, partial [bacterium]|nr:hypothetical protein [bacterium]